MSSKDWIKIKLSNIDARSDIWKNKKIQQKYIVIFKPSVNPNKKYTVRTPSKTLYAMAFDYEFKTRQQALRFAKAYMRKH